MKSLQHESSNESFQHADNEYEEHLSECSPTCETFREMRLVVQRLPQLPFMKLQ